MKIINYIVFSVRLYCLSPTFYFLLSFILLLLLKFFDTTYLCDSKFIEEIKLETSNFKDRNDLYVYWKERAFDCELRSTQDSDEEEMGYILEKYSKNRDNALEKAKESLIRIRSLELDIKRIDGTFKSKLDKTPVDILLTKVNKQI